MGQKQKDQLAESGVIQCIKSEGGGNQQSDGRVTVVMSSQARTELIS